MYEPVFDWPIVTSAGYSGFNREKAFSQLGWILLSDAYKSLNFKS
jgi:hypothetical protein